MLNPAVPPPVLVSWTPANSTAVVTYEGYTWHSIVENKKSLAVFQYPQNSQADASVTTQVNACLRSHGIIT